MKKRQTIRRIFPESCGLRLVEENSRYHFIDADGNQSGNDFFELASPYAIDGFAQVAVNAEDPFCWRDLLGNLSSKKTYLGKRIFQYFKGNIEIEQLLSDEELPYDEKLVGFVARHEERSLPVSRSKKKFENMIKSLREKIDPLLESYVRNHSEKNFYDENREVELIKR